MPKHLGTVSARRAQARPKPAGRRRYESDEKANRWMVTLNFAGCASPDDFTPEHTMSLRRLNAAAQVPPCTYAIFQPEVGENGTYHIQGYFEFDKRMTLAQVKKHVGERAHLDPARGTQDECIAYCSKETDLNADPPVYGRVEGGEVLQFGEPMKVNSKGKTNGSRTDWADVWKMIKDGALTTDILNKHPAMIPNVRALHHARFATQCERSRESPTKLLVLWGSPDTGKTTTAISLCEPGTYFVLTADGKSVWWDGYDPERHTTIIIDEFVGSRMPITFLNQLCDKIDINVQTKGGFTRFLAKFVIITSNFSPREWYNQCVEARQEALWRRIGAEVEFRLVDEIIDPHGDASRTRKCLHLEVHKGHWNWAEVKTRFPLDACCATAAEVARGRVVSRPLDDDDSADRTDPPPTSPIHPDTPDSQEPPDSQGQLDDSMGSEDEIARRMKKLAEKNRLRRLHSLGDSQDQSIPISSEGSEQDFDGSEEMDSDEAEAAMAAALSARRLRRSGIVRGSSDCSFEF